MPPFSQYPFPLVDIDQTALRILQRLAREDGPAGLRQPERAGTALGQAEQRPAVAAAGPQPRPPGPAGESGRLQPEPLTAS